MLKQDTTEAAIANALLKRMGAGDEPSVGLLTSNLSEMLLRVDLVTAITGLSIPTIYRQMAIGGFPKPYRITPSKQGAKAWRLTEILEWINGRERAENGAA